MSGKIDKRLEELGITLPEIGKLPGNFVPSKRVGNLLYVSGQVPIKDGQIVSGIVGQDVSVEEAKDLARYTALFALAAAKKSIPSLDSIRQVVKVNGWVNAEPGFGQQPAVINGASDLLVEVLGEKGRHARAAIGIATLPGNAPVEVEVIFEVE